MTEAQRRASLAGCPLFEGLEEGALDELAASSSVQTVRGGETVILEGEQGDTLFVIVDGRVCVQKRTASGDPWTVRFQEEGSFFGELSLIDRVPRSATVVADGDCTLLVIARERFLEIGDRYPRGGLVVTRRLAERLSGRLRRANDDVVTLFSALVQEVERKL